VACDEKWFFVFLIGNKVGEEKGKKRRKSRTEQDIVG
tara:strand:+ start:754 stop:864 length:111 start_codon:yes stop_codon:yes gene_type:complete